MFNWLRKHFTSRRVVLAWMPADRAEEIRVMIRDSCARFSEAEAEAIRHAAYVESALRLGYK